MYKNFYQYNFYANESFPFKISFYKPYPFDSNDRKCILYSNNIFNLEELYEMSYPLEHFLIIKNTPQIFLFGIIYRDYHYVIYKYPNIDNNKDIVINIRLIDFGLYYIGIFQNANNIIYKDYFVSNQIIYIEKKH